MNIKQTIRTLVLGGLLLIPVAAIAFAQPIYAADSCGGVETSIIHCDQAGGDNAKLEDTGVWGLLILIINIILIMNHIILA